VPVLEPGVVGMGLGEPAEQLLARVLVTLEAVVHILLLEGASAETAPELADPLLVAVLRAASIACLVEGRAGSTVDPARPHGIWDSTHFDRPMMGGRVLR
jgi:hypothetical protein